MLKKARVWILAVMTATVLLLGSSAAFAAVNNDSTEPSITKNVTIADGVTLADTTVTFEVKQVNNIDGLAAPATIATYSVNGTVSSSVTSTDIALGLVGTNGKINTNLPGEYTFEIKETAPVSGDNWTIDGTVYQLQVLVKNDKSVTYSVTKKGEKEKTDLVFNNSYVDDAQLAIGKSVVNGEYVPADKEYTITVAFTSGGATAPIPETVAGEFSTGAGSTTPVSYTVTNGAITVTLKAGESVNLVDLPAGLKYVATESDPSSTLYYDKTMVQQVINGDPQTAVENLSTGDPTALANLGSNKVAYTNYYKKISPTGLIISYLPYIAMILLAIAALALYVVSKRRRAARY